MLSPAPEVAVCCGHLRPHLARCCRGHSQSHVHRHEITERAARDHRGRPRGAGRVGRRHLQRWVAGRAQGTDGVRPSLRAHDVQGLGERRSRGALSARVQQRRQHERHHQQGPDAVFRDDAGQSARPGAVSRSRPHADTRDHKRQSGQPATRGSGGAASRCRQSALRQDLRSSRRACLRQLRVRTFGHRVDGRSRCRVGRRCCGVLQDVLRTKQRGPRHRRRRQDRRGSCEGSQVLRGDSGPAASAGRWT